MPTVQVSDKYLLRETPVNLNMTLVGDCSFAPGVGECALNRSGLGRLFFGTVLPSL